MMAARSMIKGKKMEDLLQTTGIQVLDANEDTTLSGAREFPGSGSAYFGLTSESSAAPRRIERRGLSRGSIGYTSRVRIPRFSHRAPVIACPSLGP